MSLSPAQLAMLLEGIDWRMPADKSDVRLAEVAVPRELCKEMLRLIAQLRAPPASA